MMIDSHCHLDFAVFDHDRQQVLQACSLLGVSQVVIPGTKADSWRNLLSMCQQNTRLNCALGIHPYFIEQSKPNDLELLVSLLQQHRRNVCAVGEIGLDFATKSEETEMQQTELFVQQLNIAEQFQLPVIVHHRRSHNQIIGHLKHTPVKRGGVIHAFSGSFQQAKSYVDMGFYLGVGGTITYSRAQKTREAIKQIPLQYLMLETDAPDMPINGKQGMRNSPEYLPDICNALAELKGCDAELIAQQTTINTRRLFNLS